jgi:hypothetical protein
MGGAQGPPPPVGRPFHEASRPLTSTPSRTSTSHRSST